jgi:hypothetical protein
MTKGMQAEVTFSHLRRNLKCVTVWFGLGSFTPALHYDKDMSPVLGTDELTLIKHLIPDTVLYVTQFYMC